MIINIKKRKFLIIIEEYAQFGSLENYLKYMLQIQREIPKNGLLKPIDVLRMSLQLITILQNLHDNCIVHGHLSLSNVMVVDFQHLILKVGGVGYSDIYCYLVQNSKYIIDCVKQLSLHPTLSCEIYHSKKATYLLSNAFGGNDTVDDARALG